MHFYCRLGLLFAAFSGAGLITFNAFLLIEPLNYFYILLEELLSQNFANG